MTQTGLVRVVLRHRWMAGEGKMAGISTSLIGNKYINVNILNEIAARFTELTEKCLKTHETAADDDANSEG